MKRMPPHSVPLYLMSASLRPQLVHSLPVLTQVSTAGCARTSARSLRAAEETFPGEIRVPVRAERNISEVKGGRERMQGSLEA